MVHGCIMQKLTDLIRKYYEQLSYLFFGGLATLLNFVILNIFQAAFGIGFATGVGNILNNAICILFAYWTNRNFVFLSKSHGAAAWQEFTKFVGCRIFTAVLDQLIMWGGVGGLGPMITFVSPELWANIVKLFSQVVVILSNYAFSKILIFTKKAP